jgi:hypothetical protein
MDPTSRLLQTLKEVGTSRGWDASLIDRLHQTFGFDVQPPKLDPVLQIAPESKQFFPALAIDQSIRLKRIETEFTNECEERERDLLGKRKFYDMESLSDGFDQAGPPKKAHQSRGAHVKARPEMHANARSGQRHWGSLVQILRQEWEEKRVGIAFPHFQDQIQMCMRSHIKSQHECLLRMLRIAALEDAIRPLPFIQNEKESFLGWTGFQINPVKSENFQKRITNMFERSTKQNTINNAFRRAGLVPDQCWSHAWCGLATFQYQPDKRAVYHRSNQDSNAAG